MDYREKLRPGKRVNAFYPDGFLPRDLLDSAQSLEGLELQNPDSPGPKYLYEWDNEQQKVVGRWVNNDIESK